ncbi:MAG: hypothetical protein IKD20_03745, partial [Clostridia bacterium]|nr:hypothetical protein [Clostridia bacterium]
MKNKRLSIIILSLVLMLSTAIGALATAPSGYDLADVVAYDGQVIGIDADTKGNWLSTNGLYTGGDFDHNRVYGRESYMLPMAEDAFLGTYQYNGNRPAGVNYTDYDTWVKGYDYNFGDEGDLVEKFTMFSYASSAALHKSNAGSVFGSGVPVGIQLPRLALGSLDTYAAASGKLEGEFGVITEFTLADDDWHYISVYLSGKKEQYRVALINDTFSDDSRYWEGSHLKSDILTQDIISGRVDVDAYVDILDYQAEEGLYVTFKVRGAFTLITGCQPDYSRQMVYGKNINVYGYFIDPIDSETETISSIYTKIDSRQVSLQWTTSAFNRKTVVLRKIASEDSRGWKPIAVIPQGIVSYVDKTAEAGMSYNYALTTCIGGSYDIPKVIASTFDTDQDYVDTTLSFSNSEINTSKPYTTTVGKAVTVTVFLKRADGTPISGEKVFLQLSGKFIGGMVADVVYTEETASNGRVNFSVPCNYANQEDAKGYHNYGVHIYTEYNDTLKYKPAYLDTTLTVKHKNINTSETAPYILELSDSVKGGDILNITGNNLYEGTGISLYATPAQVEPTFDESGAIALTDIVQYDLDGHFINVRLPETIAGIYDIWAVNASGYVSMAHADTKLNAPRIFWISEDSAFAGIRIKITGTNFLPSYFGADGEVIVKLTSSRGNQYFMPVISVNNYCVEFEVTDIPLGEYDVSVSTDGEIWSNYPDEQTLTVVPEGVGDPLGLGVAWANKFNYTDIFNVVDYGATPNDTTDDTNAFWIAIRQAQVNGGGVVLVPRGIFYVSTITMQNGIILMGESRKESVLKYCGERDGVMIRTANECTGLFGIYNLHVTIVDENIVPDQFFQLGDQWGNGTKDSRDRVATHIFVKDVDCVSPLRAVVDDNRQGDNSKTRAIFAIVIMDEHFVLDNCYVYGLFGVLDRCYMNKYLKATDNHFEFVYDTVVFTASYSMVEGNDVICRSEYYNLDVNAHSTVAEQSHGIFHRDRSYIAGNTIKNVGQETTDGEVICAEPIGACFGYGMILSTGINELYPNKSNYVGRRYMDLGTDWGTISDIKKKVFGKLALIITGGTGMGQIRFIDPSMLEGDALNRVYLLDTERDWDVVPDSTSTFSLETTVHQVIIYNNYAYDATKGMLLYGNFHDSIVADNYNENTEGICVWSAEIHGDARFSHNYRITVRDNVVKGRSKCGYVGIGTSINFTLNDETNQNTSNFHVEFRNNYFYGDRKNGYDSTNKIVYRKYSTESEAPNIDGYYVYVFRNSTPDPLALKPVKTANVLFSNNYIENTLSGIYIGDYLISGVLVDNMTYVDVTYPHGYEEYYAAKLANDVWTREQALATIKNVVYSNEKYYNTHDDALDAFKQGLIVDVINPIWADASIDIANFGSTTYAYWTEAFDDRGVRGYMVYADGEYYDTVESTSVLINRRVSHVSVYAIDHSGNKSTTAISSGDSLIVNPNTSVGSIIKGITNRFTYSLQVQMASAIDKVTFSIFYDASVFNYVSALAKVSADIDVNNTRVGNRGKIDVTMRLTSTCVGFEDLIDIVFAIADPTYLEEGDRYDFEVSDVKLYDDNYIIHSSVVAQGVRPLYVVSKVSVLDFTEDGQINSADYNYV